MYIYVYISSGFHLLIKHHGVVIRAELVNYLNSKKNTLSFPPWNKKCSNVMAHSAAKTLLKNLHVNTGKSCCHQTIFIFVCEKNVFI